jgi:DNA polymerase-3 subunit beta
MLIDRTQFAISTEETRYYLNGIFVHTIESEGALKLRAVATDGHRLARADVDAPSGSEGMPGIIIPRKTVGELQKLVDNPDLTVTVEVSDAKIRFTIGSVVHDLETDRRHLPRLSAGDPDRQRQGADG